MEIRIKLKRDSVVRMEVGEGKKRVNDAIGDPDDNSETRGKYKRNH